MEFDETDEFGSLMRQNTAISRMMTTYTRFVYITLRAFYIKPHSRFPVNFILKLFTVSKKLFE